MPPDDYDDRNEHSDETICDELVQSILAQPLPHESMDRVLQNAIGWSEDEEHRHAARESSRFRGYVLPLELAAAVLVMATVGWFVFSKNDTPVDQPTDSFSLLIDKISRRDNDVSRISFTGVEKTLSKVDTERLEGESNEEFIQRYAKMDLEFNGIEAPISITRDYPRDILHLKYSDIDKRLPKYLEYYSTETQTTQLMGVDPGRAQATITEGRLPKLNTAMDIISRLDILALRPVQDRPLGLVLLKSKRGDGPSIPDGEGREAFDLSHKTTANGDVFVATFRHFEPSDRGLEVLWFRVYLKTIGDQLVIHRVEELSVVGSDDSMPRSIFLLEDFQSIDGVLLPHRVRYLLFGNNFLLGKNYYVSDMKINDAVEVPEKIEIPAGTSIRNQITGKRTRAGN